MVTAKILFCNFKTMADRVPDCDTKELQQFKENAENSNTKKSTDLGYCLENMGGRKRIQSRYCKLRSQGNLREASEVFHRGEKEGWFRLRVRSLREMIASLDRRLKEAGSSISIAKDREFVNSRKVLQ